MNPGRYDPEFYTDQIGFLNSKIKEFLDSVVLNSEQAPIIIVQSDEGPWPQSYALDYLSFDWRHVSDLELDEKSGILSAYVLPDGDYSVFYRTISRVESFRVVLNNYFGTILDLLPDRTFHYGDENHPYEFFDVTDRPPKAKR